MHSACLPSKSKEHFLSLTNPTSLILRPSVSLQIPKRPSSLASLSIKAVLTSSLIMLLLLPFRFNSMIFKSETWLYKEEPVLHFCWLFHSGTPAPRSLALQAVLLSLSRDSVWKEWRALKNVRCSQPQMRLSLFKMLTSPPLQFQTKATFWICQPVRPGTPSSPMWHSVMSVSLDLLLSFQSTISLLPVILSLQKYSWTTQPFLVLLWKWLVTLISTRLTSKLRELSSIPLQ